METLMNLAGFSDADIQLALFGKKSVEVGSRRSRQLTSLVPDSLLFLEEIAAELRCPVASVRSWVASGKLPDFARNLTLVEQQWLSSRVAATTSRR